MLSTVPSARRTIIGATFDAVDTPRGLQQSLEAHREKGLILVDTPGYGAADMEEDTPVALLAQTTLSHDTWSGIMQRAKERFESLWMPNRSDLCFATTNRQAALKAIAGRSDAVVVIGSVNSSNTRALEKVARASGCARVLRVNEASELPADLSGTVGVTAGASAPDELVTAVVRALDPAEGVEEVHVTDEDEYFPPPPELRDLLRALAGALTLGLGAPADAPGSGGVITATGEGAPVSSPFAADRLVSAADVLAALAG